jgi:ABC-2 type transport system permease protein
MMMQMRRPPQSEFAYLTRTLENDFSVRSVSFGSGRSIPASAETLLLIRPKEQSDQVLYELDQFLMRGGRLVVCADHFSLDAQQSEMTGSIRLSTTSNPKLAEFLAHFGIRVAAEMLADSRSEYLPVPGRVRYVAGMPVREYVNVAYPYFLRLPREAFSTDDQLTAGRAGNALLWACPVELADPLPEGVTGRVLARTSPQAWTTTSSADVESILEGGFAPPAGSRSYGVAAVVRGRFRSYFAERPLPGLEKPEGDGGAPAEGAPERTEAKGGFLTEAARPSEIVVIGDSDWLSPAVLQTFRQSDSVLNENLRWLITLLERADATDAAVAARSRAPASRPLTGLSGLAPEERDARGRRAFLLVTLASLGLLGAVGLAWAVHRARQQPMTLAPPESQP